MQKYQYLFDNTILETILDHYTTELEELKTITNIGEFFEKVNILAATVYFSASDHEFLHYRQSLEQGFESDNIRLIVEQQNYTAFDPEDSKYDRLLGIGSLKEQIVRNIYRKIISAQAHSLELTETERIILLASCDIGDYHDMLYRQWLQYTVVSEFAKELRQMGAEKARAYLQEQGALPQDTPQFLYVVFKREADNTIKASSYAEAFPEAVSGICSVIDDMIMNLKQIVATETDILISYFTAFKHAVTSKNQTQHEDLWAKVDREWMKVSGRMQPIHMMEAYKDSLGLCVDPEYALGFLDDRFQQINQQALQTKTHLISFLKETYGDKKSLQISLAPMQASVAGIYTFFISGFRLDFRPAGQNVPNREEVRVRNGVKIFMDMKTMHQRWTVIKKSLNKLFSESYVRKNFSADQDIITIEAGVLCPGHEVAHNAFIQIGTREKIGARAYKDIEENKSSLAIAVAIPSLAAIQADPYQYKKLFIENTIADVMLRIAYKEDLSKRPYYHDATVNIRALLESNILEYKKETWMFAVTPEKAEIFYNLLTKVFAELVNIYDKTDPQMAEKYINTHYKPPEAMGELEERLKK